MAYTTHGHHIPNTEELPPEERPQLRAQCGSFSICRQCKKEAMDEFYPPPKSLTAVDAYKILEIVFNWIHNTEAYYGDDLKELLNRAGYTPMGNPDEQQKHYRK